MVSHYPDGALSMPASGQARRAAMLQKISESALAGAGDVICVLGIDPGPHTGMCLSAWARTGTVAGVAAPVRPELLVSLAFECGMASAGPLLTMILRAWPHVIGSVAIEEFRRGPRSVRLRGANAVTIGDEITQLRLIAAGYGLPVVVRPAVTVKNWADDARLAKCGLLDPTNGLGHARDAARHALYCAVKDLGLADPLSKNVH